MIFIQCHTEIYTINLYWEYLHDSDLSKVPTRFNFLQETILKVKVKEVLMLQKDMTNKKNLDTYTTLFVYCKTNTFIAKDLN